MIKFNEFRKTLSEAKSDSDKSSFRVGKYKALIKKENNKFVAYIDGDRFEAFKTEAEAKKGLTDFVDMLGKTK
jgi:hypothetical protein